MLLPSNSSIPSSSICYVFPNAPNQIETTRAFPFRDSRPSCTFSASRHFPFIARPNSFYYPLSKKEIPEFREETETFEFRFSNFFSISQLFPICYKMSFSFHRFSLRRASRLSKMRGGHKKVAKTESGENSGGVRMVGLRSGGGGAGDRPPKVPLGLTEVDNNSLDELSRFEPPERPPSLTHLQEITGHRFSEQWLKYIYNRFKNECPTGRMKFVEFRRLFGTFIPDRVSDAYLERMFRAFCQQQSGGVVPNTVDYLTFQDLVVSLHRLCDENARDNAEWTMRLIVAGATAIQQQQQPQQHISFGEFFEFVRSVFTLRGRGDQNDRKRNTGSLLMSGGTVPSASSQRRGSAIARKAPIVRSAAMFASAITAPTAGPAIAHFAQVRSCSAVDFDDALSAASEQRAIVLFKELDTEEKGFLTTGDLEHFFARQQKPLVFVS